MVQNLDKLAIVLSVAVIALALMAQTTFANGAAQANGNGSDDVCDASPTLDECLDPDDGGEATDTDDGGRGIGRGVGFGHATDTDDGPKGDKPVPPGQSKRRGIFGTVAATGSDDTGTYVILETKFGNVTVYTSEASSFGAGDRFTALLDKSPFDATETTDSFRTATALRVKGVPGKATRKHLRSVVVDASTDTDDGGTLTILDEDGNEIVLAGGASGTLDGEDTILLIQQLADGLDPTVLGGITSFSVSKRLEKLLEKGSSPEKLTKLAELIQKRVDKLEARLQRIEDRAPAHLKDKVRGARDKSKGKGRGASGGDGDNGDGGGKGKPDKDKPDKGGGGGKGKPDK